VGEINERMPHTHGNSMVPFDRLASFVHTDRPLAEAAPAEETEVEGRIGEVIAGRAPGRSSSRQITLYESQGMGLQDVYVGAKVLALARERGVGSDLPIGL